MNEEQAARQIAQLLDDVMRDMRTFRFRVGTGEPPSRDRSGEAFKDAEGLTKEDLDVGPGEPWVAGEPLDPTYQRKTNIRALVGPALMSNAERDRIVELLDAGRFGIRPMQPDPDQDPDTFTLGDAFFQAYVQDEEEIIEIVRFPATVIGHYYDVD